MLTRHTEAPASAVPAGDQGAKTYLLNVNNTITQNHKAWLSKSLCQCRRDAAAKQAQIDFLLSEARTEAALTQPHEVGPLPGVFGVLQPPIAIGCVYTVMFAPPNLASMPALAVFDIFCHAKL